MNHARAGGPEGAEQRAAPSGTPALRVGPRKGPTRRCEASPGPDPGCASRLDWALCGAPRGRDSCLHRLSTHLAAVQREAAAAPAVEVVPERLAHGAEGDLVPRHLVLAKQPRLERLGDGRERGV